jgi:hypothetical protein
MTSGVVELRGPQALEPEDRRPARRLETAAESPPAFSAGLRLQSFALRTVRQPAADG